MRPLAILVTGDPVESVERARGSFADLVRGALGNAWQGPIVTLDARRGELPEARELGALVITGSPSSVTSRDAWIVEAERAVAECVEAELPSFGICFGHQLLAQALGGSVVKNPRGREIGTVEVEVLDEDPLFGDGPLRFHANMSHVDTVERLPPGARRLARSELDQHAAVRFGERAWGVQFHPEFDAGVMRGYVEARRELLRAEAIDVAALALLDAPETVELLRRFTRLASAS